MKISIITATLPHPERSSLILETYSSLLQQECDWEWLIQVDQHPTLWPEGAPAPNLPEDKRIKITLNDSNLKLAKTRNAALKRASGDYVMTLDDDDTIYPRAIDALIRSLEKSGLPWASASIEDFSTSGREDSTRPLIAEGPAGPNIIPDNWSQPWDRFPLIPACSIIEKNLVEEVGGWEHLPQGEDILFLTKIDALRPALISHMPFYRYRQHKESFFSPTASQHWWKYINEESPEDFKRTRETVFLLALRYLYESDYKFSPPGQSEELSSIVVETGGIIAVCKYSMCCKHPVANAFFSARRGDLLCRKHVRKNDPNWEIQPPETRPERILEILSNPGEIPHCVACGNLFLEVRER